MKIKTKLSLGVGFLFLLIILLIGVSVRYIHSLALDTRNILVANYNTIDYSRQMLNALDEDMTFEKSRNKFRENLEKQRKNITEEGELTLTDKLTLDFKMLESDPGNTFIYKTVRKDLTDIMLLNMQAIQRKSTVAENTSSSAIAVISITGSVCFLLAFTLLLNLPGNIANPIRELTENIKAIAAKNYSRRVYFEHHNEFGELAHSFNIMAGKLEEYNNSNLAKLLVEKKRIEILMDNMMDPVLMLDENREIIFINKEAIRITGLKETGARGRKLDDLASDNDLIRSLISGLTAGGNRGNQEPLKIYADQKESYFRQEVIPIDMIPTGENGSKHIGDVILLRNITYFKELDLAKTNFIATVSHEFKTPIHSIKLCLQLLENEKTGGLNEEQRSLVESIRDDSDRLLKITGELLDMTRVESGNIQVSMAAANAKDMLMYAVNANKVVAEQKKIILVTEVPEDIPAVKADKEKTAWVLVNLVSNAIRYSHEGSAIQLKAWESGGKIFFSVKDHGHGIAPEYTNRIFDRYFRVPGDNKEGTGLGLAISKEFIEAQGGNISVASEFSAGSTFTVMLNRFV